VLDAIAGGNAAAVAAAYGDDLLLLAEAGRMPVRLLAETAVVLPPALAVRLLDAAQIGHPGSGRLRRDYLTLLAGVGEWAVFARVVGGILGGGGA